MKFNDWQNYQVSSKSQPGNLPSQLYQKFQINIKNTQINCVKISWALKFSSFLFLY